MTQWRLNVAGGLKLSAPEDSEWEFAAVLSKTRANRLPAQELNDFAENWLLVTTELLTDGVSTPALFLINKVTERAIVVSSWPTISVQPPPAAPAPAAFDPSAFFGRATATAPQPVQVQAVAPAPREASEVTFVGRDGCLSRLGCSEGGGMTWRVEREGFELRCERLEDLGVSFSIDDQFTLAGPIGYAVIADPPPGEAQRQLVSNLVALALEQGVQVQRNSLPTVVASSSVEVPSCNSSSARPRSMSNGDKVEVKYQGAWFRGVLCALNGEVAHVNCDADEGGVITVAPIDSVRLVDFSRDGHSEQPADTCGKC
jgi:hypothetical protein